MRIAIRLAAALALLALPVAAQDKPKPVEQPFLWVIEGETPSFLFGTIHVPDERVTTLPDVVLEAIEASDGLYCELAMDMGAQMAAAQKMLIPGGKQLKDLIPADLYARLEVVWKQGSGMPFGPPFSQMKPQLVAGQLEALPYLKDMMRGKQALDQVLYSRAQKAKKKVGGLEVIEEQLGALEALDGPNMLRMGIEEAEKKAADGKEGNPLLDLYLAGDLDKIEEMYKKQMAEAPAEFREVFEGEMVTKRNKRMAERIASKLKENPGKAYFFAVGTLHYPGEEGILKLLEAAGYKLRRLSAKDAGTLAREPAGAPR